MKELKQDAIDSFLIHFPEVKSIDKYIHRRGVNDKVVCEAPKSKNSDFEFIPFEDNLNIGDCNKIRIIKNINDDIFIELKQLPNKNWVIILKPYDTYWHQELKQFVIYTDPNDFSINTQFEEQEAFALFYTHDLIAENNETVG